MKAAQAKNHAALPTPKLNGFALVRCGKTGRPKIDGDPRKLHPEIIKLMTPQERKEIGLV